MQEPTANHRDAAETPMTEAYAIPDGDLVIYRARAPHNGRTYPPPFEVIVISAPTRTDLRFATLARAALLEEQGGRVLPIDEHDMRSRGMGWEREVRFVRGRPEVLSEWDRPAVAPVVELASWMTRTTEPAPVEPPSFRELTREDRFRLLYVLTRAFGIALSGEWAGEGARNFAQAVWDGQTRGVYETALRIITSETRAHARLGGEQLAELAAARAVAAYVDHVTGPTSELQRWGVLLAVGVPLRWIRDAELRAALVVEERCA